MEAWSILGGVVAIALAYVAMLVAAAVVGARWRRRVVCPFDGRHAAVRCDARNAAKTMLTGGRQCVTECSLWPDRAKCDRRCEETITS